MPDGALPRRDPAQDDAQAPDRVVLCGACSHPIARIADRSPVGPSDLHTFMNPAGEVFELVCFREADGAAALGEPTLAFTWFPGHAWRFAACRSCGAQLGWRFEGPALFWGLIRRALRWP